MLRFSACDSFADGEVFQDAADAALGSMPDVDLDEWRREALARPSDVAPDVPFPMPPRQAKRDARPAVLGSQARALRADRASASARRFSTLDGVTAH